MSDLDYIAYKAGSIETPGGKAVDPFRGGCIHGRERRYCHGLDHYVPLGKTAEEVTGGPMAGPFRGRI